MLTAADRQQMTAGLRAIRDDRAVQIAIRRGNQTRPAQTVRVARGGNIQAGAADAEAMQAAVGAVIVVGEPDLDIRPGDRFTLAGALYEVTALHPVREHGTQAQARQVH